VPVSEGPAAPETRVIPRVSPLRGVELEGTISVTIGGPASRAGGVTRAGGAARGAGPAAAGSTSLARPATPHGPLPPEPRTMPAAPPAFEVLAPDGHDEPPLPDEARAEVVRDEMAETVAVEARPDQVLHVRFASAPSDRIVAAFGDLRTLIRERPGPTQVVLHVPSGPGREQEMQLRVGVAYDADLLADVRRRFGRLLELTLA
jgi:hypothetical protein